MKGSFLNWLYQRLQQRQPVPQTLSSLYGAHEGKVSDKWSRYLIEYDRLFSNLRNKPVSLLEIGVQNGGSLEIWSKYFTQAKCIIGCDIDTRCANLHYDDPRIQIVIGDATEKATFDKIENLANAPLDIIIDDGSHKSGDIIKSFATYFSLLSKEGLFIAEDLHCSYWHQYDGGIYHPLSSMAFFKCLPDLINHEHWGIDECRSALISRFTQHFSLNIDETLLAQIHSLEFFNSTCVVRKKSVDQNVLGTRQVTGSTATVNAAVCVLHGSSAVAPEQASNAYSNSEAARRGRN